MTQQRLFPFLPDHVDGSRYVDSIRETREVREALGFDLVVRFAAPGETYRCPECGKDLTDRKRRYGDPAFRVRMHAWHAHGVDSG